MPIVRATIAPPHTVKPKTTGPADLEPHPRRRAHEAAPGDGGRSAATMARARRRVKGAAPGRGRRNRRCARGRTFRLPPGQGPGPRAALPTPPDRYEEEAPMAQPGDASQTVLAFIE